MKNIEQRIQGVRNDREHGSRWLVREAILILRDLARDSRDGKIEHIRQKARELARARPAMAALAHAVGQVMNVQGGPEAIEQAAEELLQRYTEAPARIAEQARPYLQGQLMTCSLSGTVLDILTANRQALERVIVLEGRPLYEGRKMAQSLSQQGLAVTLITDAQADIFMAQCQSVVVGADSILANGDVLNKAGTALLAWSAQGHKVPFYVLCETLKISPQAWSGNLSWLEEKEGSEVWPQAPEGLEVRNFYFDRTPTALVSKLITEQGELSRAELSKIVARAREDAQKLTSG
ncbi:translation initiation factor eIF-2B [Ktedonosporobacter rubrisoli]|uniref:Translation initiation factor eIF-2B n=1 Tax=Ktedonosporobacter rubrisoli TaxID=2509675 RepID=A0A4P6JV63_KTERU|nr:translation initiation factor eIF-2B [Ktedonosporobacter rubrisoli]QBD79222.1 translation initiation factor eIF-2B [Ktedonosporobacter rubrisoli]